MLEHIRVHRREVTKDHLRETMHLFRSVLPAAFLVAGSVDSSSSIAQSAYAELVRRAAPSVVTVLAEEQGQGAARLTPGSKVFLVFMRDGAQLSIPFTVGRLPDPPPDPALTSGPDPWAPGLAFGLADTTAEVRKAIKTEAEPGGLIVTQLRAAGAGAPAWPA
jgi:hypothetical protein